MSVIQIRAQFMGVEFLGFAYGNGKIPFLFWQGPKKGKV